MWSSARAEEAKREHDELAASIWAFACCLCADLRGDDDEESLQAELCRRLGRDAAATLVDASAYRPVVALCALSGVVERLGVGEKRRVEMDKSVIVLMDACEACERIFSSPVPLVYTRHTARFLSTWLLLLPLGMAPAFTGGLGQWALVPAATLLAIFLFGIDELAVQLEEPFSILPLETYCDGLVEVAAQIGPR